MTKPKSTTADNRLTITVCRGTNVRYLARGRWYGYRLWDPIGKPTKSYYVAIRRMAEAFANNRNYKRADVIMWADYYDPEELCQLVRR